MTQYWKAPVLCSLLHISALPGDTKCWARCKHWDTTDHPRAVPLLGLMVYSYLFILILIFNIQDTRILLRHGASGLYLQIWACADFFLGLFSPAYPGMLWYNIVQVSLLLCLEKKQISSFMIASPYLFFGQKMQSVMKYDKWDKIKHTLNGTSKRCVFPNPDIPEKQKINFKTIPGIMQQYKQYSDSSQIKMPNPSYCHIDLFTAQMQKY